MADAASRLIQLQDRKLLSHFLTHFPQSKPWRLPPLSSAYRRNRTTILHNKQSPRGSHIMSSINAPLPGTNGGNPEAGCKLSPNSKTFNTPFPFSIFYPSAYVPAFCPRKGNLSRRDLSSNTFARLVKSLHPWGPITPTTTEWGSSNFGWDTRWNPIIRRITLQQECGPSLSESSNPWTPLPREPPQ